MEAKVIFIYLCPLHFEKGKKIKSIERGGGNDFLEVMSPLMRTENRNLLYRIAYPGGHFERFYHFGLNWPPKNGGFFIKK